MHRRLGALRLNGLAAHRIDVALRRHPAELLGTARLILALRAMLAVSVPHDMRAATEPHHQEDQAGGQRKVEQCFHGSSPLMLGQHSEPRRQLEAAPDRVATGGTWFHQRPRSLEWLSRWSRQSRWRRIFGRALPTPWFERRSIP